LDMVDYLLRLPGMTFADLLDLCLVSFWIGICTSRLQFSLFVFISRAFILIITFHWFFPIIEILIIACLTVSRVGIDPYAGNPIVSACENGHVAVVRRMLDDPRVDPSCQESLAIQVAAQEGMDTWKVRRRENAKLLMFHFRSYFWLVFRLFSDCFRFLIQFSVAQSHTVGHSKIVRMLMADHRVDTTRNGSNPMKCACANGTFIHYPSFNI
jgi:hypothetical protein